MTPDYRSPALALPGAVPPPPGPLDQGVPWHYGDPHQEQRRLVAGQARVDQSELTVLRVTGGDRLSWLHSLLTAKLADLLPGSSALALELDPQGHVEHEIHLIEDGESTWLISEPNSGRELLSYLDRMRFTLDVNITDLTAERAVVWVPVSRADPVHPTWIVPPEFDGRGSTEAGSDRGGDASRYVPQRPGFLAGAQVLVPRTVLLEFLTAGGPPAGTWALEALRVAAAIPRFGSDTDHRSLPHELGWIGPAVHLAKGCYRGQETVARVHNMGRPPRRLVLLHLDGSDGQLPDPAAVVSSAGRPVGWIGTPAWHYELGPIATAVIKRGTDPGAALTVASAGGEIAASQEVVVSP